MDHNYIQVKYIRIICSRSFVTFKTMLRKNHLDFALGRTKNLKFHGLVPHNFSLNPKDPDEKKENAVHAKNMKVRYAMKSIFYTILHASDLTVEQKKYILTLKEIYQGAVNI
jgi:hypothetical protein